MYDGTEGDITVSFPAVREFHGVGKAAVSGLAIRLGVDFARVENLRMATDTACQLLSGVGTIHLQASWEPDHLDVFLQNTEAAVSPSASRVAKEQILKLVDQAVLGDRSIGFAIEDD